MHVSKVPGEGRFKNTEDWNFESHMCLCRPHFCRCKLSGESLCYAIPKSSCHSNSYGAIAAAGYGTIDPSGLLVKAAVKVCGQEGSWFATSRGTRQGDPISPTVFIADLERAMDKVKDGEEGISVHRIRINNLRFADDIDIIEEDESTLERTVHSLHKEAMRYGLI